MMSMESETQNSLDDKFERSVSLLAWAYNEEELIGEFLDRAVALLESCVSEWEIVQIGRAHV